MSALQFVLISRTPLVKTRDLYALATALELNARDCALAWGKAPPAIDVADTTKGLTPGCNPIFFVDTLTFDGVLAEHFYDPLRGGPAGRVYVTAGSGFNRGSNSACEAASHEILEALVNPAINLWVDHPNPARRDGVQIALENADPSQRHYIIKASGSEWSVSNFVHPAWFDQRLAEKPKQLQAYFAAGRKLDHLGELKRPGEIGPLGYAIVRERVDGRWKVTAEGPSGTAMAFDASAAKSHLLSRTRLLGVQ